MMVVVMIIAMRLRRFAVFVEIYEYSHGWRWTISEKKKEVRVRSTSDLIRGMDKGKLL